LSAKPPPLQLTNPTTARPTCPACGKQVKDMSRHAGTAACSNAARVALIDRLGLVEVWWREAKVLSAAGVAVTVIRDQRGKDWQNKKLDKRRWYAAPAPVAAMRVLREAGLEEKRVSRLLSGPKDELEREIALAALSGKNEERQQAARSVLMPQSSLQTSRFATAR
jgi:hypothetical protein